MDEPFGAYIGPLTSAAFDLGTGAILHGIYWKIGIHVHSGPNPLPQKSAIALP